MLAGIGVIYTQGKGTAAQIDGASLDPTNPVGPAAEHCSTTPPAPPPPPPTVDVTHFSLEGDHYEAPRSDGSRARLTLDPEIQAAAEKLLIEAKVPRGAIVAMAPDGKILAIAGRKNNAPDISAALDVWAPAASVFKLVTASALVANGMDPDDKVCFHGGLRSVVESNLRDDKRDNNCQSLLFGVAHSNNAILGKLAFQHLEPTTLATQAHALGIDRAYDLGGTSKITAGSLLMPPSKDLTFAETAAGFTSWTEASGHGEPPPAQAWGAQLSALGGATLAATFADDGEQPTPYLVEGVAHPTTRSVAPDVARKVGRMMSAACEFGSASKSFRHAKTHVAGKTGTLTQEGSSYTQYSWFVGFAPADKPEYVVSVVLGNPEDYQFKGHEVASRMVAAISAIRHGTDHDAKASTRKSKHHQW